MKVNQVSFKGKYIIDGTKSEINEIEKKLPKTVNSYKCVERLPICYDKEEQKYMMFYATDRDSISLNKAKKEPTFMEKLKEIKSGPLDMFKFLANYAFGSDANINLFNASDLLKGSRTLHGFHSSSGSWNGHIVKQLNGGSVSYDYNGKASSETIVKKGEDGVTRTYKKSDKQEEFVLETEQFPDGTFKKYYPCGFIEEEKFPDGTFKNYYINGQISREMNSDGTLKSYYLDGQISREMYQDGTYKSYYENGQIQEEKYPNGTFKRYYKNGQISAEKNVDKSENYYHANGNLKKSIDAEGKTVEHLYREGDSDLIFVISSNDSENMYYDKDGKIVEDAIVQRNNNGEISINFPDGSTHTYNKKTKLSSILTPDGTLTEFLYAQNGKLNYRVVTTPDGTIKKFIQNTQKLRSISKADGSYIEYFARNGEISEIRNPDGSGKAYYISGGLKYEASSDGTYKQYASNGQILLLIDNEKYQRWSKNGTLLTSIPKSQQEKVYKDSKIHFVDDEGNERVYYGKKFNNRLAAINYANGSWIKYRTDGIIEEKRSEDGTISKYNSKGLIIKEITPDNQITRWSYDDEGNISSIKLPDGVTRIYKDGVLNKEILADGVVIKHYLISNENIKAYSSFSMKLRWFFSKNTKKALSIDAKANPRIAALIKRIEENKEYLKILEEGGDVSELEYKPLTKKEEIAYRSYTKKVWRKVKTEEFIEANKKAKQVIAIMLEKGIEGIEDPEIRDLILEWKQNNEEKYNLLFN